MAVKQNLTEAQKKVRSDAIQRNFSAAKSWGAASLLLFSLAAGTGYGAHESFTAPKKYKSCNSTLSGRCPDLAANSLYKVSGTVLGALTLVFGVAGGLSAERGIKKAKRGRDHVLYRFDYH